MADVIHTDELLTIIDDGVEFEVIWDGREGLIGPRESAKSGSYEPIKRLYNKKSDYWESRKSWTFQACVNNDHDKCVSPTEDGGICKCSCHKPITDVKGV